MRKPCLVCGVVTPGPSWCEAHTPVRPPRRRPNGRYSGAWRRASSAARKAQPWCSLCGSTTDLTGDHVIPLARGGDPEPPAEEIVVLCRRCNSSKGARLR